MMSLILNEREAAIIAFFAAVGAQACLKRENISAIALQFYGAIPIKEMEMALNKLPNFYQCKATLLNEN